ncbi:MAG: pectate lyase [Bacteroidales bacterium]|nr:pectate lyase [Bacteroidales bacterium]
MSNLSWEEVANRMPAEWYASDQAAEVAETVLNHQTKIGGWTKNTDFHKKINEEEWAKVSESGIGATFDNAATITEMRFLAKMYKNRKDERYKDAFIKGFNYILKAQYDNGGWPQFYPARPNNSVSYSACITFNDNAYVNVMNMLKDIFTDAEDLKTLKLDDNIKKLARESFDKGVRCILDTQIIVDGERTVWCAQHDQVTLKPAKARAYELPSFSGAESVNITLLLMSLPSPSDEVVAAIKGAVKWFDKHKIPDMKYERYKDENGEKDSKLVPSPGSVVWARFYDLETEKPFFCGRDGIKKETLQEIEKERRGGYSWYNNAPSKVLKEYPEWLNKIN